MTEILSSSDVHLRIVSAQATIAGAAFTLGDVGAPSEPGIEGSRRQYYGAVESLHLAAADLQRIAEALEPYYQDETP